MNKKKIIFSIICNFIIVISCAISVGLFFNEWYVTNVMKSNDVGVVCFRYFTVLSNVFMAIVSLMMIVLSIVKLFDKKAIDKWVYIVKYVATISVSVTFITVVIFLAPLIGIKSGSINGYFSLFANSNFVLHFMNPVLAVLTLVLFEDDYKLEKYNILIGLSTVFIYSIIYFINVVALKTWKDFYYFTFGGHNWVIPITIIFMYSLTFFISFIIYKLYNRAKEIK